MKKTDKNYKVITNVNIIYYVKAKSKNDALDKIHSGKIKPYDSEVISDDVID